MPALASVALLASLALYDDSAPTSDQREGESVVHLGELVAAAKGKPRVTYTGRLNI